MADDSLILDVIANLQTMLENTNKMQNALRRMSATLDKQQSDFVKLGDLLLSLPEDATDASDLGLATTPPTNSGSIASGIEVVANQSNVVKLDLNGTQSRPSQFLDLVPSSVSCDSLSENATIECDANFPTSTVSMEADWLWRIYFYDPGPIQYGSIRVLTSAQMLLVDSFAIVNRFGNSQMSYVFQSTNNDYVLQVFDEMPNNIATIITIHTTAQMKFSRFTGASSDLWAAHATMYSELYEILETYCFTIISSQLEEAATFCFDPGPLKLTASHPAQVTLGFGSLVLHTLVSNHQFNPTYSITIASMLSLDESPSLLNPTFNDKLGVVNTRIALREGLVQLNRAKEKLIQVAIGFSSDIMGSKVRDATTTDVGYSRTVYSHAHLGHLDTKLSLFAGQYPASLRVFVPLLETTYVLIKHGCRVVLLINGLGATPLMELMVATEKGHEIVVHYQWKPPWGYFNYDSGHVPPHQNVRLLPTAAITRARLRFNGTILTSDSTMRTTLNFYLAHEQIDATISTALNVRKIVYIRIFRNLQQLFGWQAVSTTTPYVHMHVLTFTSNRSGAFWQIRRQSVLVSKLIFAWVTHMVVVFNSVFKENISHYDVRMQPNLVCLLNVYVIWMIPWNAILFRTTKNALSTAALLFYKDMRLRDVLPINTTLKGVLTAYAMTTSLKQICPLDHYLYFNSGTGSIITTTGTVEMEARIMNGNLKIGGVVSSYVQLLLLGIAFTIKPPPEPPPSRSHNNCLYTLRTYVSAPLRASPYPHDPNQIIISIQTTMLLTRVLFTGINFNIRWSLNCYDQGLYDISATNLKVEQIHQSMTLIILEVEEKILWDPFMLNGTFELNELFILFVHFIWAATWLAIARELLILQCEPTLLSQAIILELHDYWVQSLVIKDPFILACYTHVAMTDSISCSFTKPPSGQWDHRSNEVITGDEPLHLLKRYTCYHLEDKVVLKAGGNVMNCVDSRRPNLVAQLISPTRQARYNTGSFRLRDYEKNV
ncbi:putative peptidase T2, asparaginase 2, nucleophile aminohydrolase [Helianthus debilis subsp. tardiflorus]